MASESSSHFISGDGTHDDLGRVISPEDRAPSTPPPGQRAPGTFLGITTPALRPSATPTAPPTPADREADLANEARYRSAEFAALKAEHGEAGFEEMTASARWAVGHLDGISGGKLNEFLVSSGIGDDPGAIRLFAAASDLIASKDAIFSASIPVDRTAAAQHIARELDARLGGTLSSYLRAAGLDSDPTIIGMFSDLADVLRGSGPIPGSANPVLIRRRIDELASSPDYTSDGPRHKIIMEEISGLYRLLAK